MDRVPAMALALARATGTPVSYVKHCYGIAPEQMSCIETGVCDNCGLCPPWRTGDEQATDQAVG